MTQCSAVVVNSAVVEISEVASEVGEEEEEAAVVAISAVVVISAVVEISEVATEVPKQLESGS